MNLSEKEALSEANKEKYRSMNLNEKEALIQKNKQTYESLDAKKGDASQENETKSQFTKVVEKHAVLGSLYFKVFHQNLRGTLLYMFCVQSITLQEVCRLTKYKEVHEY